MELGAVSVSLILILLGMAMLALPVMSLFWRTWGIESFDLPEPGPDPWILAPDVWIFGRHLPAVDLLAFALWAGTVFVVLGLLVGTVNALLP